MLLSVACCGLLNVLFVWQKHFAISFFTSSPEVFHYASLPYEYSLTDTMPCLLLRDCRSCTSGDLAIPCYRLSSPCSNLRFTITVDIPCLSLIARFRRFDGYLSYFVDRDWCCRFGCILRGTKKLFRPKEMPIFA